MFNSIVLFAAAVALISVFVAYDPCVPFDAEDYWILMFIVKLARFSQLKRYLLGDNRIIDDDVVPPQVAPVDLEFNNYKTRFEDVDVRIYDPVSRCYEKGSTGPLLIYIHGGGWVHFNVDIYDLTVYHLSKLLPEYLVVSIDYRLAPAHPYPAALEDIDVVYRFLIEHAASYKIDVNRIVIAGDSAGGNLAAGYSLKLRDANRNGRQEDIVHMPKLQALIYPALQAVDLKTPSYHSVSPILPKRIMAAFWNLYLTGSEDGTDQLLQNEHQKVTKVRNAANRYVKHALIPHHLVSSYSAPQGTEEASEETDFKLTPNLAAKIDTLSSDPYFSPLLAEDLSDLPSAYVIACQYDVLRDDAILYGRRLSAAGVAVETRVVMGAWHGNMFRTSMGGTKKGIQMTEDMAKFIKENV